MGCSFYLLEIENKFGFCITTKKGVEILGDPATDRAGIQR